MPVYKKLECDEEQNKVEVTDLQNSLRLAQEEVPKLQGQLVEVEGQLAAALAEVTRLKAEKELSEAVVQDLQQALVKVEDKVSFFEKRLAEVEARNCQILAHLAAAEADSSQVKDLQEQLTAARAAVADLVMDKEENLATIKNLQGSLSQAQEQAAKPQMFDISTDSHDESEELVLPEMPSAPPESDYGDDNETMRQGKDTTSVRGREGLHSAQ